MANTNKPVLGYWNLRGYGHPIRFMLAYMGVDYEEKLYPNVPGNEDWVNEKPTLGFDFPNLPYWIDENVKITESKAILKYLARKYDQTLIPSDLSTLWKAEMLEGVITDIWGLLIMISYYYSDMHKENFDKNLPLRLGNLSKFLGSNKFTLGDKPYYVDFLIYECLYHYTKFNSETLKPFPNLEEYLTNFEAIPTISKYMESPNFIKTPLQGATSKYKL